MFASLNECAKYYVNVMDEVRQRAEIIEATLNPIVRESLPSPGGSDLAVLQLRKMCECVALACLAAHSAKHNDKLSRAMGHYRADLLIKSLEKADLQSFPIPDEPCAMTRDRLIRVYHLADEQMHVGMLPKRGLSVETFKCEATAKVAREILGLLRRHVINLSSVERFVFEMADSGPDHTLSYQRKGPPSGPLPSE